MRRINGNDIDNHVLPMAAKMNPEPCIKPATIRMYLGYTTFIKGPDTTPEWRRKKHQIIIPEADLMLWPCIQLLVLCCIFNKHVIPKLILTIRGETKFRLNEAQYFRPERCKNICSPPLTESPYFYINPWSKRDLTLKKKHWCIPNNLTQSSMGVMTLNLGDSVLFSTGYCKGLI